jgi:hypothetical protein
MTSGLASLSNLRDLALPQPVAWWPLQAGWWIIFAGLLALAAFGGFKGLRAYHADAYRRMALAELKQMRRRSSAGLAPVLAALIKRTALASFPRDQVAALTGDEWFVFLDRTAHRNVFSGDTGTALLRASADPKRVLSEDEAKQALAAAGYWIRRHRRGRMP